MVETPVVSSQDIATETYREDGYAFNRTRNLSGDRWGEGSFNDPEWARKVLKTPADPDGDGMRNRDHERAPSYSAYPESGVFPFKVPYRGLGFNNNARDPQLVVPFNNTVLLNPALTGSRGEGVIRLQANARAQWLGSSVAQNKVSLSADSYLKGFGGIGAYATYQNYGKGLYTSNEVGISVAPVIALSEGKPNRPGATLTLAGRAGYVWNQINSASVAEQRSIEVQRGEVAVLDNSASQLSSQFGYQDFGLGAHLNTGRFYAGASVDHLTQPVEELYRTVDADQHLERKYIGYVGTDFSKKQESDFVYSPALLYQTQGNLDELWITNTFAYKGVQGGFGYATSNAARLMAGVKFETFEVNYNFDLTDSELMQMNKGSHEIALRWLIK